MIVWICVSSQGAMSPHRFTKRPERCMYTGKRGNRDHGERCDWYTITRVGQTELPLEAAE